MMKIRISTAGTSNANTHCSALLLAGLNNNPVRQKGFTLFELLLVVTIMAFAAGTVLFLVRPNKASYGLKSAVDMLASRIRTERNSAIHRQRETLVRFDLAEKSIDFQTRGKKMHLADNVVISVVAAESERSKSSVISIRFFPDGSSTGGTVTLKQESLSYDVHVNWLTGRVSTNATLAGR